MRANRSEYQANEELARNKQPSQSHIATLDPFAPRQSLKDAVPYSAKKLDSLTRSWLSHSPEFKPQKVAAWDKPLNREPIFPAWTRSTTQPPCLPFETGRNTLPGMEEFSPYYEQPTRHSNATRAA